MPEEGASQTLVVIPSVNAVPEGDGFFLDRKAVDGLSLYARLWPGPVRCLMRAGRREEIGFGKSYRPEQLPFEVRIIADDLAASAALLQDAALCLAAGDNHRDFPAVDFASRTVFIIEYTLATRLRIIRLEQRSAVQALKSTLWTLKTEVARRRAFRRSAGLQCNGTPAFDSYRRLAPSPLLYFDTRMSAAQQITDDQLAAKQAAVQAGKPLRLAFSGRLERMKGADHLIPVAEALRQRGVAFTLSIYGDGSLRAAMQRRAAECGLASAVTFHGPVDFDTALVPALIGETDLFLCCHRQADPSCTYLETLSCGVPIVGYDNAAFTGVLALGDMGVPVAINQPEAAADAITALDRDRERITAMMATAGLFGRSNSFERVFASRIDHLRAVAG